MRVHQIQAPDDAGQTPEHVANRRHTFGEPKPLWVKRPSRYGPMPHLNAGAAPPGASSAKGDR